MIHLNGVILSSFEFEHPPVHMHHTIVAESKLLMILLVRSQRAAQLLVISSCVRGCIRGPGLCTAQLRSGTHHNRRRGDTNASPGWNVTPVLVGTMSFRLEAIQCCTELKLWSKVHRNGLFLCGMLLALAHEVISMQGARALQYFQKRSTAGDWEFHRGTNKKG